MKFRSVLIAAAVLGVFFVPAYIDWRQGKTRTNDFAAQAKARQLEAKVMRTAGDLTNPFTWFLPSPTYLAARQVREDGRYLVMYAIFTKDLSETNKSLVWADCSQKQLAVVTVDNYQAFLKESGYDLLGKKLPSWEAADYNALLAVLIQTKSTPSGQSVFFDIACNWDSLPSI